MSNTLTNVHKEVDFALRGWGKTLHPAQLRALGDIRARLLENGAERQSFIIPTKSDFELYEQLRPIMSVTGVDGQPQFPMEVIAHVHGGIVTIRFNSKRTKARISAIGIQTHTAAALRSISEAVTPGIYSKADYEISCFNHRDYSERKHRVIINATFTKHPDNSDQHRGKDRNRELYCVMEGAVSRVSLYSSGTVVRSNEPGFERSQMYILTERTFENPNPSEEMLAQLLKLEEEAIEKVFETIHPFVEEVGSFSDMDEEYQPIYQRLAELTAYIVSERKKSMDALLDLVYEPYRPPATRWERFFTWLTGGTWQ